MIRSLLVISVSLSLASCATDPKPANSWWKSLSDPDARAEDSLSCRGVRSGDELDRLASCWPPSAPPLVSSDIGGLEEMSPALRDCLLMGLPALVVEGEDGARCHQGLAEVIDRRLYQLGWLKAEVRPEADASTGASSRSRLAVQLGQRYRIGEIFVSTGPSQRVDSKKIIKRAQKAVPKKRWCTQTALEEIQTRVFDPSKFQQVQVAIGAPDDAAGWVPVIINIQE